MLDFLKKMAINKLLTISELERTRILSNDNILELRKKTNILIIDDDGIPVVKDLKENFKYNITEMIDLERLEDAMAYNIILCDIHNVGKKFDNVSELGGIEMIRQLRKAYPEKYIVFFSSYGSYDSTIEECFRSVDDTIQKKFDTKYLSEKLDSAITDLYNPRTLWTNYSKYLTENHISTGKIALIEDFYVRCIKNGGSFDEKQLNKLFENNISFISSFKNMVSIATFLLKVFGVNS